MTINEHLAAKGIKAADFAEAAGISASHLSLIMARKRKPSPIVASRIERASGGDVKVMTLLFDEAGAA